jgi:hypothetical protein
MSYVWNTFGILANHREFAVVFVAVALGGALAWVLRGR